MKYKKYPSYKDSGVEWLGEIPTEWNTSKIKHLFNLGRGRVISLEELEDDGKYPVYSSQTKHNGILGYIKTYDFNCRQITWTTDGANAGTIFLREGKHNCTNVCGTLQPRNKSENLKFITYSLQYATTFYKRPDTNGAKIMNGEMAEIFFTYPPIDEQQQIATYLDNATAKIDTLIEKQTNLIEILKEKRQAVISHAVTKGINPNVPMKDSGVEWLGKIPEHWDRKRLKHCTKKIKAGPFGSSLKKDVYTKSGYKVYGQEQVIPNNFNIGDYYISEDYFNEMRQYEVKCGDILISCVGTYGKIALFPENGEKGIINPRLILIRLNKIVCPQFLEWYLKSTTIITQMSMSTRGGTMDIVNISILSELTISLPEMKEQQKIVNYLDDKTSKMDKLIEKANKSIELLKEKRTALISAAVTGKIDVRK